MRLYVKVTGVFFSLLAAAQLARTVWGVPIRAAHFDIPVWCSGVAFLLMAAFAVWAWRAGCGRTG